MQKRETLVGFNQNYMFDLKCNYVKLHQERSVVRIMKGVSGPTLIFNLENRHATAHSGHS